MGCNKFGKPGEIVSIRKVVFPTSGILSYQASDRIVGFPLLMWGMIGSRDGLASW